MSDETEPISWSVASKVGRTVAPKDVYSVSYLRPRAESQLADLTEEAEALVASATGLSVPSPARAVAADRPRWIDANLASFRGLLAPLTEKLAALEPGNRLVREASRKFTGAQVGTVLGWMSGRVLGQYDVPFDHGRRHEQDVVFYVVPNIMGLEKRFAFPPEEFRLWIAAHECTHRAQFMGVPWMPEHFRSLVHQLLSAADPDPDRLRQAFDRVAKNVRDRSESGAGLMSMLSTPEQQESMHKLMGLMSLLEGHAEVVMSRATVDRIPSAERFQRVIEERRAKAGGISRLLQKALGFEAKLKQYAEGAAFVRAVESRGGRELFDRVWAAPENLPSQTEIKNPSQWLKRQEAGHGVTDDASV